MNKILALIFLSFAITSCYKDKAGCFDSMGEPTVLCQNISEKIDSVSAFGRISVNFIQDSLNYLEIKGGANVVEGIKHKIEGTKLTITDENKCNWVRKLNQVPIVTIHYTQLNYFNAGNYFDNKFLLPHKGKKIHLEYWNGSGCTKFIGNVDSSCFAVHAGYGSFECYGTSKHNYIYHHGNAKINCGNYKTVDTYVYTFSNNDIYINSSNSILGLIEYSGNIIYSGQASIIKQLGEGKGKIIYSGK